MIHPGTTCVVCLAGIQEGLALHESGHVVAERFVNVSVAYDHRVINGRDAVLFLQAIKNGLEYPAALG